ncbi:hypothetical protein PH210_19055 [Paenibacillus sp. BSR1-1]|uniref:hypothetical protein n=1 Tax=Paenibacillus sp. BSR1-1 TaxID=3020845 RepID=UPI0025AF4DBD|nr:hypothetical protein [Paenibacillus sp. BSR1-1]MDN3018281.1 hypothetical protein [Paenibacillus sp. BSR1-1]
MVKNKKFLLLALFLLIASMVINFPFPHEKTFGGTMSILNMPITTVNGISIVGITAFSLLIAGLFFLAKSLKKYQGRFIFLAIFLSVSTPHYFVELFQRTVASGIYAVSYDENESSCRFDMINKTILHGECDLPFENYSKNDVQFTIEFYEEYAFEDDVRMLSLMNNNAPYRVKLGGKEHRHVKIETNIDVSKMAHHIDSGEANGINIIIKSGKNSRKL